MSPQSRPPRLDISNICLSGSSRAFIGQFPHANITIYEPGSTDGLATTPITFPALFQTTPDATQQHVRANALDPMVTAGGGAPRQMTSPALPVPRNEKFIGRGGILDALDRCFPVTRLGRRLALVGLGGIGKSQIACEFAYRVRETYEDVAVYWVSALNLEGLVQDFTKIATHLGLVFSETDADVITHVCDHLSTVSAGKWLLIIDNADDEHVILNRSLARLTPYGGARMIMLTTRHDVTATVFNCDHKLRVTEMLSGDAVDMFKRDLIAPVTFTDEDVRKLVVEELQNLPLAISQAASYINTRRTSVAEYLRLLQKSDGDKIWLLTRSLMDHESSSSTCKAIAMTWYASFARIQQSSPDAARLLSTISLMEAQAIPRAMLPPIHPEARMADALGILKAYDFITVDDHTSTISMHRLVHLSAKTWSASTGQEFLQRDCLIQHLCSIFPAGDPFHRVTWRPYLPHVIHLLRDTTSTVDSNTHGLSFCLGLCLLADRRALLAASWLSWCFCWRSQHLPEEDPRLLEILYVLAIACRQIGLVAEAIELLEHLLTLMSELTGLDIASTVAAEHVLAGAYRKRGNTDLAIRRLEHIIESSRTTLAENHPSLLSAQHELAITYRDSHPSVGGRPKAVQLLKHVVRLQNVSLAEEHPNRLASHHELAKALRIAGSPREAVQEFQQVIAIRKRTLPDGHPDRLASQHELAEAYRRSNNYYSAMKEMYEVVIIKKRTLRPNHPSLLKSQERLRIYLAMLRATHHSREELFHMAEAASLQSMEMDRRLPRSPNEFDEPKSSSGEDNWSVVSWSSDQSDSSSSIHEPRRKRNRRRGSEVISRERDRSSLGSIARRYRYNTSRTS